MPPTTNDYGTITPGGFVRNGNEGTDGNRNGNGVSNGNGFGNAVRNGDGLDRGHRRPTFPLSNSSRQKARRYVSRAV